VTIILGDDSFIHKTKTPTPIPLSEKGRRDLKLRARVQQFSSIYLPQNNVSILCFSFTQFWFYIAGKMVFAFNNK
jgi:hypothetical protein